MAQLVLNQIDEDTLDERSKERLSRQTPPSYKWQIAFYRHVLELERAGLEATGFVGTMRRLVDTSVPEWSEEEDFIRLVRSPEFHIARHEAR